MIGAMVASVSTSIGHSVKLSAHTAILIPMLALVWIPAFGKQLLCRSLIATQN